MSKTIWKFEIFGPDIQVSMPEGAKILAVQMQQGSPKLWALVDKSAPVKLRHLRVFGTDHPMPDDPGEYLGTFQQDGGAFGAFVFHVFDAARTPATGEGSDG